MDPNTKIEVTVTYTKSLTLKDAYPDLTTEQLQTMTPEDIIEDYKDVGFFDPESLADDPEADAPSVDVNVGE